MFEILNKKLQAVMEKQHSQDFHKIWGKNNVFYPKNA